MKGALGLQVELAGPLLLHGARGKHLWRGEKGRVPEGRAWKEEEEKGEEEGGEEKEEKESRKVARSS